MLLSACGNRQLEKGMKKLATFVVALLVFSLPLFSEAQSKKNTITKTETDVFQVKSVEVFYNDKGVFIHFSFFQPADIDEVIIPSDMLKIIVSSEMTAKGGTHLALTYDKTVSAGIWGDIIKPHKATIWVSQKSVEQKWLDKIGEVSKQYRESKNKEVIPIIKK